MNKKAKTKLIVILIDDSKLLVNEKHRVYSGKNFERGYISNLSSFKITKLPSKSSDFISLSSLENALNKDSSFSCRILNQTIENICSLLNSRKSSSLVTNTRFSDLENSASLPFESLFGFDITSTPCCLRNLSNLVSTFSSNRSLGLEGDINNDIFLTPCQISCILQCCPDVFFSQGGECFKDFFKGSSVFKHFQDLPDHDSCTSKSRFSMADFAVRNDIFVDFNSHITQIGNFIFKPFEHKKAKTIVTLMDNHAYKKSKYYSNPSSNSLVEYILIEDCFLRFLSYDQTPQLSFNANAKYGISFACSSNNFFASALQSYQNSSGTIPINTSNTSLGNSNSSSSISAFLQISILCLSNSDKTFSGATNCRLYLKSGFTISSLVSVPFLKKENNILASTTNNIHDNPSFFSLLYIPSFTFLPNSIASCSVNLEFSNNLLSADNIICLLALSPNSSLTAFSNTLDQTISECFLISFFKSPGISIFNSTIPLCEKINYLNISSKTINRLLVNPKHGFYIDENFERGYISNLSSFNVINLPSKSSNFVSSSNLENDLIKDYILRCGILNQTTEDISPLENLRKSSSLVTNTRFSDLENSASLPFESLFGFDITSTPCCLRNLSNLVSTFSSNRSLGLEGDINNDIFLTPCQISCILQCCPDVFFSQGGECFKDFFKGSSVFKHFQDLPDHDSCTSKSRFSMADFAVRNDIFVDFNSHITQIGNFIFKPFEDE